jgi:hypothetical protein
MGRPQTKLEQIKNKVQTYYIKQQQNVDNPQGREI